MKDRRRGGTGYRWLAGCLLAGFCFAFLWGKQEQPVQEERIRVDVNLVTLRFTVKNAQGEPVNDLDQTHFRVYENGEVREIVYFDPPRIRQPRGDHLWLAFLLDVSGSTFGVRSEQILAAQTFLDNVHNFTQVGVFGFTDQLMAFQPFTHNRELAARAFSAAQRHLGKTAIYDSLTALIGRISQVAPREGRKAVIVISDGLDEDPSRSEATAAYAREHSVSIYTVLVPSAAQLYIGSSRFSSPFSEIQDPDYELKVQAFSRLSLRTGGRHFGGIEAILDFDDVMSQIHDHIFGNLYSLGYYTPDPLREIWERDIQVEVDAPAVEVSELFKKLPERMEAKKKFIAALFDNAAMAALPRDLQRSFREIGAELDVLSPRRDGAQIGLPFRVKINPYSLQGTQTEGVRTQLGIIGLMIDSEGKQVVRLREFFRARLNPNELREGRGIIYNNKLFAPPGTYDLRIALLEIPTWKMTVFENVVRIPAR